MFQTNSLSQKMEEYDREFLTFTVKDEPDSEDDFIGFEGISPYANVFKQFILVEGNKEQQEETIRPSEDLSFESQQFVVMDDSKEKQQEDTNMKSLRVDFQISVIGNHRGKFEDSTSVKIYICDICGAKYSRKSKLRTHILNHVVKGPNDLPICEYCGEVFDSIDTFFDHFEQTHDTNGEDVLLTFKEIEHVLCCEYCGNAYAYPDSLNKHRSIHSGNPKPYLCQFCENCFDAYSKLVTHSLKHNDIKTDYPVDRYWMCDFPGCSKALKNITSLNYHKKNVHQKKYMSQVGSACSITFLQTEFEPVPVMSLINQIYVDCTSPLEVVILDTKNDDLFHSLPYDCN